MDTCSGPECDRWVTVKSRGLCQSHAVQQRKGKTLRPVKGRGVFLICNHEGCESAVRSLGYCGRHYRQFYRWGKTWGEGSVACSVDDCPRPECARALCEYHYLRASKKDWRANGSDTPCDLPFCPNRAGRSRLCSNHRQRATRFGLTDDELVQLVGDGSCHGCGRPTTEETQRGFCVHHNHDCCDLPSQSCGYCVEAYLCGPCNSAAGFTKDNPDLLRKLAGVIDNPPFRKGQDED